MGPHISKHILKGIAVGEIVRTLRIYIILQIGRKLWRVRLGNFVIVLFTVGIRDRLIDVNETIDGTRFVTLKQAQSHVRNHQTPERSAAIVSWKDTLVSNVSQGCRVP